MIYETETEYQYARVVEYDGGVRRLELNEGQAIHSTYRPGTVLTGNYWDGLLVDPFAALRARARARRDARHRGRARPPAPTRATCRTRRSTRSRSTASCSTSAAATSTCATARSCARSPRTRGPFLRRTQERYDVIMVDAYRQPYIPFYLTTKEFFELARDRLAPGGVVAINVGHPEGSDRLEQVLSATLRSVFGSVARDPLNPTNTILMGSDAPLTGGRLLAASRSLPADLRPLAVRAAGRLRPGPRGRPRLHRRPRAGRVARRRVARRVRGGRVMRVLITGAAGTIGRDLRAGLRGRARAAAAARRRRAGAGGARARRSSPPTSRTRPRCARPRRGSTRSCTSPPTRSTRRST